MHHILLKNNFSKLLNWTQYNSHIFIGISLFLLSIYLFPVNLFSLTTGSTALHIFAYLYALFDGK